MWDRRQTIDRSQEEWLKIIDAWKSSQKSIKTWCRENNIPNSSFRSAYNRLFPTERLSVQKQTLQRSCFHELKETQQEKNGIELSFKGVTLRLNQNFDECVLLNLLRVLEKL